MTTSALPPAHFDASHAAQVLAQELRITAEPGTAGYGQAIAEAMMRAVRTGDIARLHARLAEAGLLVAEDDREPTIAWTSRGERTLAEPPVTATSIVHLDAMLTVIAVVHDILGETNRLTLNTALEAARAGSTGPETQSIAQVVNEVKKLAEQTKRSTNEIERIIAATGAGSELHTAIVLLEETEAQVAKIREALLRQAAAPSIGESAPLGVAIAQPAMTAIEKLALMMVSARSK